MEGEDLFATEHTVVFYKFNPKKRHARDYNEKWLFFRAKILLTTRRRIS
jgi:hypothetical protein